MRDKDKETQDNYWDNHPEEDKRSKVITIVVLGGCVADVHNLPEGYTYELYDHDLTDIDDEEKRKDIATRIGVTI